MAEYEERSLEDLTEEPSQQRLDELRQKGTVAQSRDLTSTLVLMGVSCTIYFFSKKFIFDISEMMKDLFSKDLLKISSAEDWRGYIDYGARSLEVIALCFFPIGIASIVCGVVGSIGQVGFMISTDRLAPDFDRIHPVSGFKRVYSLKSLVEGGKSFAKLVVVVAAIYIALKANFFEFPNMVQLDLPQVLSALGTLAWKSLLGVILILFVSAAVDYWIQWRRFRRQAMMTKAEAKQDLKEREGDPQIRARIRSIQRETARKRMMKSIPKADVIITNPTHIAVAIAYVPEEGIAPKVLAKGGDYLAERIKKIAREHGIPTVENKPLARTLYKHVKVGQMIPRSLYQAVAEILAYVYKLKGRSWASRDRQTEMRR